MWRLAGGRVLGYGARNPSEVCPLFSPAAPIPPKAPASPPRWRDHLVAALLPLHLLAVLVYVAPNPPRVDDEAPCERLRRIYGKDRQ